MDRNNDGQLVFREVQQFRQKWLWSLLLITDLFLVVFFGYGMLKQLVYGQAWGDRPMSDPALAIAGTTIILFTAGITYLIYSLKMITEVREDGVHIQFSSLSRRTITFADVVSCEVRTYRPIKEYGGWGIRYGRKGKAYNVYGDRGVQLEIAGSKPLLIGSQKPEELAGAIRTRME